MLISGTLDKEIDATLQAIRNKDPRVYKKTSTFYTNIDDEQEGREATETSEKPMYLHDYHRKNLMDGHLDSADKSDMPPTYAQEQDYLRDSIVKEMHAAAEDNKAHSGATIDDEGSQNDTFLVRKASPKNGHKNDALDIILNPVDIDLADKDPEAYLSNFMSARAWVPSSGFQPQPFESDDEEEERRAEDFEEAYNLRFEDPKLSNEKLISHARDTASKFSVRRDATNPRKKARESEQKRKEAEKLEREQEKSRLRKLRVAEAEEKVRKIKEAAGLRGEKLGNGEWIQFLDEGWDDDRWEAEMQKFFGDDYYADNEFPDNDIEEGKRKKKPKKPEWKDDININDLIPGFDEGHAKEPEFTLSDDSDEDQDNEESTDGVSTVKVDRKDKKSSKREGVEQKREARRDRRKIEQLVDGRLDIDLALSGSSNRRSHFKYRETSPLSYGLTAHDILMASDSQLNQYAGLKKMATFRDAEKKKKDKKHLGKKARLRQWRKETFGSEKGPQKSLKDVIAEQDGMDVVDADKSLDSTTVSSGQKRKRSRKHKVTSVEI